MTTGRDDVITVEYLVHGGDPKDCRRCYASTRPCCKKCGHALSGNVETRNEPNTTTCEFCFTENEIQL